MEYLRSFGEITSGPKPFRPRIAPLFGAAPPSIVPTKSGLSKADQAGTQGEGIPAHRFGRCMMQAIGKALWYIESHFNEPVTLDDVAEISGLSRFHLSRHLCAPRSASPSLHTCAAGD